MHWRSPLPRNTFHLFQPWLPGIMSTSKINLSVKYWHPMNTLLTSFEITLVIELTTKTRTRYGFWRPAFAGLTKCCSSTFFPAKAGNRRSDYFQSVLSNSLKAKSLGRETSSVPILLDTRPHFRQDIYSDGPLSLFKTHLVSIIMHWLHLYSTLRIIFISFFGWLFRLTKIFSKRYAN